MIKSMSKVRWRKGPMNPCAVVGSPAPKSRREEENRGMGAKGDIN